MSILNFIKSIFLSIFDFLELLYIKMEYVKSISSLFFVFIISLYSFFIFAYDINIYSLLILFIVFSFFTFFTFILLFMYVYKNTIMNNHSIILNSLTVKNIVSVLFIKYAFSKYPKKNVNIYSFNIVFFR